MLIKNFLLTLVLAIVFSFAFPWWGIMIAAFIASICFPLKRTSVFLIPFLAILLLWMSQTWYLSSSNDFILAKKIAILLPLGGNTMLLILITGVIGGLAAGITAIFGKQCSLLIKTKP